MRDSEQHGEQKCFLAMSFQIVSMDIFWLNFMLEGETTKLNAGGTLGYVNTSLDQRQDCNKIHLNCMSDFANER